MGGGADETLLQVAAHTVRDGERDDEGGHTGGDADDGDCGDKAYDTAGTALAAACAEVAGGDEEFEAHWIIVEGFMVTGYRVWVLPWGVRRKLWRKRW